MKIAEQCNAAEPKKIKAKDCKFQNNCACSWKQIGNCIFQLPKTTGPNSLPLVEFREKIYTDFRAMFLSVIFC